MSQITWLASYPRSGNTWTRFMLTSYMMDKPLTIASLLEDMIPDFHFLLKTGKLHGLIGTGRSSPGDSMPLLVKTHYRPSSAEMQWCRAATNKVIYIVRNPRDVLLSTVRFSGVEPSPDKRSRSQAEHFIVNRGDMIWHDLTGSWPQNVHEWTSLPILRQYFPRVELLAVRYEDMRNDPVAKLHQVVDFLDLGVSTDPDRIRRAVGNSSIDKMRELEARSIAIESELSGVADDRRSHYVNQGKQGQSLDVFGTDIELAFQRLMTDDEEFSECARRFGYDG